MQILKTTALALGLALFSAPAYALVQNVACTGDTTNDPGVDTDSELIDAALDAIRASGDEFSTLNLSGSCALSAPIDIRNFPTLVIQGSSPATPISAVTVPCGTSTPPPGYSGTIMSIVGTRNITLRDLNISGGGGVFMQDSAGSFVGVSITGSRGDGLAVQGASTLGLSGGTLTGPSPGTFTPKPNVLSNNCNNGLSVGSGSSVGVLMLATIANNGNSGVFVNDGSVTLNGCCTGENAGLVSIQNNRIGVQVGIAGGSATLNGGSTCNTATQGEAKIQNNSEWGVVLQGPTFFGMSGLATVQNNQTAPTSNSALAYRSGIYGSHHSTIFVSPGAKIQNNVGGPGIWADMQTTVRLGAIPSSLPPGSPCNLPTYANPLITTNGAEGLRLTKMSGADIQTGASLTGNPGADATCDDTSYLFGVLSGVNKNKCKSK